MSYIDFGEEEGDKPMAVAQKTVTMASTEVAATSDVTRKLEEEEEEEETLTETVVTANPNRPPAAYIPSAQYMQSARTITPLSQMQVLGDYGEMMTYNASGEGVSVQHVQQQHQTQMVAYQVEGYSQQQVVQNEQQGNNVTLYPQQYHVLQEQQQSYHPMQQAQPAVAVVATVGNSSGNSNNEQMTETESIAMDIMGLFNVQTPQGTQTPIEEL